MRALAIAFGLMLAACNSASGQPESATTDAPEPVALVPQVPEVEEARPARVVEEAPKPDPDALTPLEQAVFDRAMKCDRARKDTFDPELLRQLLRLEREFDVPPSMRGMVLAASCHEAGFNVKSVGDYKCPDASKLSTRPFKCKDGSTATPRAVGLLQQWGWVEGKKFGYGIDRRNPMEAARAWLSHVVKQMPKVTKLCRYKAKERLWVAAWVTSVRRPKKTGRCREKPTHYRRLKRWRKDWDHLLHVEVVQR